MPVGLLCGQAGDRQADVSTAGDTPADGSTPGDTQADVSTARDPGDQWAGFQEKGSGNRAISLPHLARVAGPLVHVTTYPTPQSASSRTELIRGSAPASSSGVMSAAWPWNAARHSGLRPNSPRLLGAAPAQSSAW
jgi:hypothetical protein